MPRAAAPARTITHAVLLETAPEKAQAGHKSASAIATTGAATATIMMNTSPILGPVSKIAASTCHLDCCSDAAYVKPPD